MTSYCVNGTFNCVNSTKSIALNQQIFDLSPLTHYTFTVSVFDENGVDGDSFTGMFSTAARGMFSIPPDF